jgi:hypothetical protein
MPNNPNAADNLTAPRFEPGQSGNPGGIPKELRAIINANAEKATRIRAALLDKMVTLVEAGDAPDLEANLLKLIKDSEDRGFGAPTNKTAFTDPDGNAVGGKFTVEFIGPSGSGESPPDL